MNFKKKRLKIPAFTGLPAFSKFLVSRMAQHDVLQDFIPVELCNLEYLSERGSSIDQHFDDFWLWGERLVTLNLLSDTVHTMTIDSSPNTEVRIPIPRRTLLVVSGPARYEWKHGIRREDIKERRMCMTFRELSMEFQQGGASEATGKELREIALGFEGKAIGT